MSTFQRQGQENKILGFSGQIQSKGMREGGFLFYFLFIKEWSKGCGLKIDSVIFFVLNQKGVKKFTDISEG